MPEILKTKLAIIQFQDRANEWYDGYLMKHEPPSWYELVRLVLKRFKRNSTRNALEELKKLN